MPEMKTRIKPSSAEVDIFARGELASQLKAATTKGAVEAPEPVKSNRITHSVATAKSVRGAPSDSPDNATAASEEKELTRASIQRKSVSANGIQKNVPLRFRVSSELKGEWTNFMSDLSSALGGVSLDDSNVGRPLLEILMVEYRDQIMEQAESIQGTLRRPPLSDRLAMAEFDNEIAQVLSKALRQRRKKPSAQ